MKRAVQFLLGLSLAVSALALWGLARIWVPYSIVEAFNGGGLFRTQQDFAAENEIRLWAGCFSIALCVAVALFTAYWKNYRHARK
jgi:hypothetical protein